MYDLLIELKEYIKEHYTGNDSFELVIPPVPYVCEADANISYDYNDIEEAKTVSRKKNKVLYMHSCCLHESSGFSGIMPKKEICLEDLLKNTENTFSNRLFEIIDQKGIKDVDLYKKANLDRRLFSKLRNKNYKPSKNTILALILALELDMQEARDLLSFAGYNLAPNNKTDIIVSFFLEKQVYDIFIVNKTLDNCGEKCLGNSIK